MSKKEINSHIFIPESILKRFASRHPVKSRIEVNYIDFADNEKIKQASTRGFNAEKGYFTRENEIKLSKHAETKLGIVISQLEKKYQTNGLNISISDKEVLSLKKYIAYQMIRTNAIIQELKDYIPSVSGIPYSNEKYKEHLADKKLFSSKNVKELKNIFITIENDRNIFLNAIKDMGIIIKFNKTNIPFLLTNNPYTINPSSEKNFLMYYTISPKMIIELCNKDSLKKFLNIKEDVYLTEWIDDDIIKKYNNLIYQIAKKYKPNILVGDYNELERVSKGDINI